MNEESFWKDVLRFIGPVLSVLLATGVSALVYGSVKKQARVTHSGQREVKCPLMMTVFGCLSTLLFAVGAIGSVHFSNKPQPAWAILVLGLFALGCFVFTLDIAFKRVLFDERGIYYFSIWTADRRYEWTDLTEISYGVLSQRFRIQTLNGRLFYVYEFMSGVDEFLFEVKSRAGVPIPPFLRHR